MLGYRYPYADGSGFHPKEKRVHLIVPAGQTFDPTEYPQLYVRLGTTTLPNLHGSLTGEQLIPTRRGDNGLTHYATELASGDLSYVNFPESFPTLVQNLTRHSHRAAAVAGVQGARAELGLHAFADFGGALTNTFPSFWTEDPTYQYDPYWIPPEFNAEPLYLLPGSKPGYATWFAVVMEEYAIDTSIMEDALPVIYQ